MIRSYSKADVEYIGNGVYRKKYRPGKRWHYRYLKEAICSRCEGAYLRTVDAIRQEKLKKGKRHYCSETCRSADMSGELSVHWRGGKTVSRGRAMLSAPKHPHANGRGYVPHHRVIFEECLGRFLTPDEILHHIDARKENNDVQNLYLTTRSGHRRAHSSMDRLIAPLLEAGAITFNRGKGRYELGPSITQAPAVAA